MAVEHFQFEFATWYIPSYKIKVNNLFKQIIMKFLNSSLCRKMCCIIRPTTIVKIFIEKINQLLKLHNGTAKYFTKFYLTMWFLNGPIPASFSFIFSLF